MSGQEHMGGSHDRRGIAKVGGPDRTIGGEWRWLVYKSLAVDRTIGGEGREWVVRWVIARSEGDGEGECARA